MTAQQNPVVRKHKSQLRWKLIYFAVLSAPLVFHLLLVAGGALLYSAPPSATASSGVQQSSSN